MRLTRVLLLGCMLALVTISALAATNSVPATKAGRSTRAIGANDLKPPQCSALILTAIALGTGGDANELVVGTAAGETVQGNKGDDCVLGGGGNDTVRGDQQTDVCIGGPGTDSFHASCEAQYQ
jgi:Ca2+-binding RTX toxin-like protein